ncbi:Bug family tripartite tricarboxylate transporter substrate binding protein [Muricoccus radiodurans]|uniref:Bug family tripartite tricarboxylate transporter substrate binding protein n=1 Tax=Muricoccus radiodurans TaxID=2231721 RepID=UPI003CEBEDA7
MPVQTPTRRTLLVAAPALLAAPALAQTRSIGPAPYPDRTVRIIVPFAAGGASDTSTRVVAQKLTEVLGQPVVVENRPGAGGTTGVDYVVKGPNDGYTLALGGLSMTALAMGLYSRMPYDPVRDLVPISPTVLVPIGIGVRTGLGCNTLAEFINLLKANPGKYTYGSAGNGSSGHISCVAFLRRTGTEAIHIPYRGSGPVFNDLLAGTVDFTADSPGLLAPHHPDKVKALVMATEERSSTLPDVPTSAEAGVPGYKAYSWFGLYGPPGTPQAVVSRIAEAMRVVLNDPATVNRLDREMGLPPLRQTPERFAAFLREEIDYWVPIVRASGARAD